MSKKDIESKVLDTNINKTLANESQSFVQSVDEDNVVEDVTNNVCEEVIQPKHKTVMISATSKISACLSDVWYAFSYTESRQIIDDSNMEEERQNLWDTVNVEVDKQVQDVVDMLKNPQQQNNDSTQ